RSRSSSRATRDNTVSFTAVLRASAPSRSMGVEHGRWSCLLCGHDGQNLETPGHDYEYASAPGPFTLCRCTRCGHVSRNPIAGPDEVAALYPDTYYTVNPASPLYLNGFIYERKIRLDIRRINTYANLRQLRSVVDIGCGDGARLFELRKVVSKDAECIGL